MPEPSEWFHLGCWRDPPPAPEGFKIEVERDCLLGIVIAYRFVPEKSHDCLRLGGEG